MSISTTDQAKLAAAKRAVTLIQDGMKIGIGTGSTAAIAVRELGQKIKHESIEVVGTPTSFAAERLAWENGIPVAPLASLGSLDLAFDGADEVSPSMDLIKGRGAAHTREKIVASCAREFVVLVDDSKMVDHLGQKSPLPVEVLPMAIEFVSEKMRALGGDPRLRMGKSKDGPVVSDQGFWILDVGFDRIDNPQELGNVILSIPGVLDHGIFSGLATLVLCGSTDGSVREIRA